MQGISNLLALDPFQEIDPMESYISFEEHQQYLNADRKYAEFFFARNGLEEEGEGTANLEILSLVSVNLAKLVHLSV